VGRKNYLQNQAKGNSLAQVHCVIINATNGLLILPFKKEVAQPSFSPAISVQCGVFGMAFVILQRCCSANNVLEVADGSRCNTRER
jgi:hypothetical protein